MKTYIVTGGFGFIGSAVVEELFRDENNFIVVIDSMTTGSCEYNISDDIQKSDRFQSYYADIATDGSMKALFDTHEPDVVLHLAAESHVDRSITDPGSFINSNVVGTFKILELVKEYGCRMVHVSTDEVYGQLDLTEPAFLETDILDPRSPYSASKAASDLLVLSYIKTFEVEATITRCCNNYGPRQHGEKLIPTILGKLQTSAKVPIYGDGSNIREWIYVDDHAKAIIEVSDTPFEKFEHSNYIRNIPGKVSHTNLELLKIIVTSLNSTSPTGANLVFEDSYEFVADRLGHDFKYEIATIYKQPLHSVKYQINFEAGIRKTIEYYDIS